MTLQELNLKLALLRWCSFAVRELLFRLIKYFGFGEEVVIMKKMVDDGRGESMSFISPELTLMENLVTNAWQNEV